MAKLTENQVRLLRHLASGGPCPFGASSHGQCDRAIAMRHSSRLGYVVFVQSGGYGDIPIDDYPAITPAGRAALAEWEGQQ